MSHDDWDTTTTRELLRTKKSTAAKLRDAEDLLDFTIQEKKSLFGSGNQGLFEKGLCDGQKCINHWVDKNLRGCGCRLANPTLRPHDWQYFRERHRRVCSMNGDNTDVEFGCRGFKSDPEQHMDREKPAYMRRVYARKVI